MIIEYVETLFGEGFCNTEFGTMVAAVMVTCCVFMVFKTVLGWFREMF